MISQNYYFISILPKDLIKNNFNVTSNFIDPNYTISIEESKLLIQKNFDMKLKNCFQYFANVKEIMIFLKTYPFLKIDKEIFRDSSIEEYIELLHYVNNS